MKAVKGAWVGAKQIPSTVLQGFLLMAVGGAVMVSAPLLCPAVGASLAVIDEERKKRFFEAFRNAGAAVAMRTADSITSLEEQINSARKEAPAEVAAPEGAVPAT